MATLRHRSRATPVGLLALILALIPAGCSNILAPQKDATHYFILSALTPANVTTAPVDTLIVGLGPVGVPDYLSRAEMVTRISNDRVDVSSTNRWAEPLDISFRRVLAHDLAIALGGAQVVVFPWLGETPKFRYRLVVTVDRFEADAQGIARLDARWTISDGTTGRVLDSSNSAINVPGSAGESTTAAVSGLNQAASEFASQLAAAITRLKSPPASGAPSSR